MANNIPVSTLLRFGERDTAIQQQQEEDLQTRKAGMGEDRNLLALQAGIERENYSANIVKDLMYSQGWSLFGSIDPVAPETEYTPDVNYRFDEDEANFSYPPSIMVNAESEAEAEQMRMQIDTENAQMQIISDNAAGSWGVMLGATFQPHVAASIALSPVSVPLAIATEIALETGSEAVLHSQQLTRTVEESALNVVFTGVAVGILGSASKFLTRDAPKLRNADDIDDIDAGAYDSVGAARVADEITSEEDRLVTMAGSQWLADKMSIGQIASTLVKSPSKVARTLVQKLGNNPLFTKAHAEGKTHGVSVEAFTEASIGPTVIATEKTVPMQKASGLGKEEFEHEVGVVMSNGDRHVNPKVQEAAEMYRTEVLTPIREEAEKVGMLEGADQLNIKIADLETEIQEIISTGQAGKGSKAVREGIEAERANIEAAADKTTVKLQKKVDVLKARLDKARTPAKDGTKRTAPASMIKQHNEARKLLSGHHKKVRASTKGHRANLAAMKKQDKALKVARKAKRDLNSKLAAGGVTGAESYFPRIYSRDKILRNWNQLAKLLKDSFLSDPKMAARYEGGEIDSMVQDTMQNMMIGRYQNMTVKGEPSPIRARSVSLVDNVLEDFLEKNASEAMIRYTQAMKPQIMFREAFGGRSLSDLLGEISDEYKVMRADKDLTPARRKELDDLEGNDIVNLQTMYDRLTNQVQRSVQPASTWEKVMQGSKVLNTTVMLGEIVVTSLPDLARPISHYGMRSFGKGVSQMVKQFMEGAGSHNSVQVKRLGAALQRTLNTRASQFADTLEPQGKWAQKGQKLWGKWTGFDMYTDIVESISAHAAMDYTLRAAKKVASKQPLSKAETKQIARMGLDAEDLLAIHKESMGTLGAKENTLKYMNTMAWQDVNLAKRVEAGIGSDIKRTIIQAGIGDKPKWMDDTTVSWLLQFQTFAMQSQNKIIVAGLQNINRHTAEGMAVMLALGASVGALKAISRGEDVSEWTAEQWVFEGIDRSGMAGALRYPLNLMRYAAASHGILGSTPSRYIDREGASLIVSPAAGIVDRWAKALSSGLEGDFGDAGKQLVKTVPFLNTMGVRNTLMTLGDM